MEHPAEKNSTMKRKYDHRILTTLNLKYQVIILNDHWGKVLWNKEFQRSDDILKKEFNDVVNMSNFVKFLRTIEGKENTV